MKGKKEYIVLGVIIIAVAAYLGLRPTDRSTYELPQLAEIPKEEITKIDITMAETSLTVNRKDDDWLLGPKEYSADTNKVDQMLDIISKLTLTAMVSESKSDQRYNLNPEKRVHVKAWAGSDRKREFDVGKAADTFRHTFVKIAGDNRIFHAEKNFRDRFEITIESLRDKQVMSFKTDEIESFKIEKDGQTTQFKKINAKEENEADPTKEKATPPVNISSNWVTDKDQTADPIKVKSFLSALAELKCKNYINDRSKEDLKDPAITVTLTGSKVYQLSMYPHGKDQGDDPLWPAISSESDYPFLLADWNAKELVKNPADLMPDKPKPEKTVE